MTLAKRILALLLGVCLCSFALAFPASAQPECPFTEDDAVADTLDPTGYYPLEVGNVWEYVEMSGANIGDPRREEVVKDTLIDGEIFHKLKITTFQYDPDHITEASVHFRYEALTDTSIVRWLEGRLEESPVRFNQDFNSCYFVDGSVLYAVEGGYNLSFEIDKEDAPVSYTVPALKRIGSATSLIEDYAYGIGRVGSVGDPSVVTNMVYARVGDRKLGIELEERFAIDLSTDSSIPEKSTLTLRSHPNPFTSSVQIRFETSTVEILTVQIVNALGQIVDRPLVSALLSRGRHTVYWDSTGFPSGLYFVTARSEDELYAVESLIKIK